MKETNNTKHWDNKDDNWSTTTFFMIMLDMPIKEINSR